MGTTPRPDGVADVIPLVRPARWDWVPRTKLFRPPMVADTVLDPDLLDRTAPGRGRRPRDDDRRDGRRREEHARLRRGRTTIAVPPPPDGVPRSSAGLIIVRLGITLPRFGDAVDEAERLGDVAAGAEEPGAASLWVGERLLAVLDTRIGDGGTDTIPVEFRRHLDPVRPAPGDQRGLRAPRSSEPPVRCDT